MSKEIPAPISLLLNGPLDNTSIKQIFKEADYKYQLDAVKSSPEVRKLLANDYEFLKGMVAASYEISHPVLKLFKPVNVIELIGDYVGDSEPDEVPELLTSILTEDYLQFVELADNKKQFVQNAFKLVDALGHNGLERMVQDVLIAFRDKQYQGYAKDLFFSTMLEYIIEKNAIHLLKRFQDIDIFLPIYGYVAEYLSDKAQLESFRKFLSTNKEFIFNESASYLLNILLSNLKNPLLQDVIMGIMKQETYSVITFKDQADETAQKELENFQLAKNQPIKLETEQIKNPIIKAILKKMNVRAILSEREKITFTTNLCAGLEVAIKDPNVFAILKLAALDNYVIELYKEGVQNNANGLCNYESKLILLGNLEKFISEQYSREVIKFVAVLVHELTHLALAALYANQYQPFSQQDQISEKTFIAIQSGIIKDFDEKYGHRDITKAKRDLEDTLSDLDFTLYRYKKYNSQKVYNAEIPAFFIEQQLLRDGKFVAVVEARKSSQNFLLLKNSALVKYMQMVLRIVELDSGTREAVDEYLLKFDTQLVMDYVRGYNHEENEVVEVLGDEYDLSVQPS